MPDVKSSRRDKADHTRARIIEAAVSRAGVDVAEVDDVVWGCAMPEASQGLNVARNAALRAGLAVDSSAATVNRFCSS